MNVTVKIPFEYQERSLIVELDCDFRCSKYDPGRYSGPMDGSYPAEGGDVEECKATVVSVISNPENLCWLPDFAAIQAAVDAKLADDSWEELFSTLSTIYVESLYNDSPD